MLRSASLLGLLLLLAASMISQDTVQISTSEAFSVVWQFSFTTGGTVLMHVDVEGLSHVNDTVQLIFCHDSQLAELRQLTLNQVCADSPFDAIHNTSWQTILGYHYDHNASFNVTAPVSDWFYLLQLNCQSLTYTLTMDYDAMNPDGEYLSKADVPFKLMYLIASCVWGGIAFIWILCWCRYCHFNTRIQQILTLPMLVQCGVCVGQFYLWRSRSQTGHEDIAIFYTTLAAMGLSRAVLFTVLLLIAGGWMILRSDFHHGERRYIFLGTMCITVTYWLYKLLQGFTLFPLVMSYAIVLRLLFSSVLSNMRKLHNQIDILYEVVGLDAVAASPADIKLMMLRNFQTTVVVYICVDVIFHLWAQIFLLRVPWVEDAVEQLLSAIMLVYIAVTYRMRPFNPSVFRKGDSYRHGVYFNRLRSEPNEQDLLIGDPDHDQRVNGLWSPGMPVFTVDYEEWLKPYETQFVLFSNPSRLDENNIEREDKAVGQQVIIP